MKTPNVNRLAILKAGCEKLPQTVISLLDIMHEFAATKMIESLDNIQSWRLKIRKLPAHSGVPKKELAELFLDVLKIKVPEEWTDAQMRYETLQTEHQRVWRNRLTVIGIKRQRRLGNPDMSMATTCHAERTNLSVRTFTRRFTRSTLGFSKKVDNLCHAVAMFVCHFNFIRKHGAHGKTPAQAAGLTDKSWTIEEILGATI